MAVSGNSSGEPLPELNTTSSVLGVKLVVLVAIIFIAIVVTILLIFFLCFRRSRTSSCRNHRTLGKHSSGTIPLVSKEINVVKSLDLEQQQQQQQILEDVVVVDDDLKKKKKEEEEGEGTKNKKSGGEGSDDVSISGGRRSEASSMSVEDPNIGWGRWYSLKEVEVATRGFAQENVIGEGGYGIVYRGVLQDGSVVAVKNLLNNKGQAEKEFKVEVEAIGKVRHKNLVGLVGYCAEGPK
ncbi:hypothetical protein S245_007017, partial [Arachis hypogaea]